MEVLVDEATPWKKVARWVEECVSKAIQDGWEEKKWAVKSRAKGEEYEGKVGWPRKWREARNSLTTEEVKWVARARVGGLSVEDEWGRRAHIRKEERICQACGVARGTSAHWLQRCRSTSEVRRELDEKWGVCTVSLRYRVFKSKLKSACKRRLVYTLRVGENSPPPPRA